MAASAAHPIDSSGPAGELSITWLGHATVLVEIDGVRLLTDPVLRHRIGPLTRIAPSMSPQDVGAVDCVLISHLHADHADLGTLRAITRCGPILGPPAAREWLIAKGFRDVRELHAGQQAVVKGVQVKATQAIHDGRRRPYGPLADAIGFLISGSRTVYFAGDTDLFSAMAGLSGVDVALLPVWGWGPRLGPGHLDPERAAVATAIIAPAIAIPIHWGTLTLRLPALRPNDQIRPAREFAALTKRYAPAVDVRVLTPGQRTVVPATRFAG
jgi:L-ascorbate metabolism protein UlaG (beta-lactamase superfamily)